MTNHPITQLLATDQTTSIFRARIDRVRRAVPDNLGTIIWVCDYPCFGYFYQATLQPPGCFSRWKLDYQLLLLCAACMQTLWYLLNPSPWRNEELNYLAEELSGVPHVPCCCRSRSTIQTLTMYQQTNRPRRAASCKGVNGILRNTIFGKGCLNTGRLSSLRNHFQLHHLPPCVDNMMCTIGDLLWILCSVNFLLDTFKWSGSYFSAARQLNNIFVFISMSFSAITNNNTQHAVGRRALRFNLLERWRTAQPQVMYFGPIFLIFTQIWWNKKERPQLDH